MLGRFLLAGRSVAPAAAYLWIQDAPAATDHLLEVLGLPADEPHRWALNLALTADGRFENAGTETEPRWKAPLPDHLIRLADGKFLDLSAPPDRLWADHYEIFHGPLPLELADHPRVLSFGGRWLLDVLLIPLSDDDLLRVREFLVAQGQAVAAEDILREIFGITPQHDAFERWRFTLGYRLQQMGKKLGVEFVGIGPTWRWWTWAPGSNRRGSIASSASCAPTPTGSPRSKRRRNTSRPTEAGRCRRIRAGWARTCDATPPGAGCGIGIRGS